MSKDFNRSTFVHCLLYWENKTPNTVWFTQPLGNEKVKNYTWKQAADVVKRLTNYLLSLNFEPKSNIVIVGKNSAEWILADLAIMAAGHVSVPVYFTINADNLGYIIEHSEAKLMIVGKMDGKTDSWPEMKQGIPDSLPKVTLALAPEAKDATSLESIIKDFSPIATEDIKLPDPAELATIIYTSGSTGRSKGVMHSFNNLHNAAKYSSEIFNITTEDRMLSYLPLAHTAERFIIEACSLYYGFHVFFADNLDTFVQDLQRAQPTVFFSVPRLWVKFQQGINQKIPPKVQNAIFKTPILSKLAKKFILKKLGLSHVRLPATGSAPLAAEVNKWYRTLGLDMQECYAMTENFAYSHLTRVGKVRTGSVGQACPLVECKISDEGEILVKSPATMLGYYKDQEKTDESIGADQFLRTGDMGTIDKDGFLYITGRVKDLFKSSKGKYISPVPIEQLLANHNLTESVCVVGDNMLNPIGLIMVAEGSLTDIHKHPEKRKEIAADFAELLAKVNSKLEGHEKLSKLVLITERWTIENSMLTPTLKIRRHELERHYAKQVPQWETAKDEVMWAK